MRFSSYVNWIRSGQILPLMRLSRSAREVYRLCFLSTAARLGLLDLLASGPCALSEILAKQGTDPAKAEALTAFLEVGINVGEIRLAGGKYHLSGSLSKALARRQLDPFLAMTQEVVGLHVPYLEAAPGDELARERLAALTNAFGSVIARSSRVCEPVLNEVTDSLVPTSGPFTLLEIGCGSGVYLFRALRRNPELKAIGVEVQPQVAESLRAQTDAHGLSERVKIVQADVRTLEFKEKFDLITLHNNIYYFPETERVAFLRQLVSCLTPGGRSAISSACPGGGVFSSYMRLWAAMTAGAGPLPEVPAFTSQLKDAGLVNIQCDKPVPFDSYRVFIGTNPGRGLN